MKKIIKAMIGLSVVVSLIIYASPVMAGGTNGPDPIPTISVGPDGTIDISGDFEGSWNLEALTTGADDPSGPWP